MQGWTIMKSRWKDMIYNEAFWLLDSGMGRNTGYKMRCGEWVVWSSFREWQETPLSNWYILTGKNDVRFHLKKNEKYKVDL